MSNNESSQPQLNWKWQVKNNPHFCIMPFAHMHVGTMGDVRPCCVADFRLPIVENCKGKNLLDIWTGPEYQAIRRDMLNGVAVKECEICYKYDREGGGSDRVVHNRSMRFPDDTKIDIVNGNSFGQPSWIDVRPGRLCNLGCRMCFVGVSSTVAEEHKKHPELIDVTGEGWFDVDEWIEDDKTYDSLKEMIPNLTTIKLAGGEPLFMPNVIKLLKWCVDTGNTHLHLDITTNGTRTKGKVTSMLSKFRSVDIQFSIDGIGYTNDYIRHGSHWDELKTAQEFYLNADKIKINMLCTVQVYNIYNLSKVVEFWKDTYAPRNGGIHGGIMIFNMVEWPNEMCIDIFPYDERLEIADELEKSANGIDEQVITQSRIRNVINRLREPYKGTDERLTELRNKLARRTIAYDKIRDQDIYDVDTRLGDIIRSWL